MIAVSVAPLPRRHEPRWSGCRRLGCPDRFDRTAGAPRRDSVVWLTFEPRRHCSAGGRSRGVVLRALVPDPSDPLADLVGTAVAAASTSILNLSASHLSIACAPSTRPRFATHFWRVTAALASSFVALAPLAWLMTQTYEKVGWWTTAPVRPAAVHDPAGQRAPRRDARDVHPDDRRPGRGRRQARSDDRQAQPSSEGDRLGHRPGDAT